MGNNNIALGEPVIEAGIVSHLQDRIDRHKSTYGVPPTILGVSRHEAYALMNQVSTTYSIPLKKEGHILFDGIPLWVLEDGVE